MGCDIMTKWIILMITLLMVTAQGEGHSYDIVFEGKDTVAIEDISLAAGTEHLFLAYTPPDSTQTHILILSPELEEVKTQKVESLLSPSIGVYAQTVYLAGIQDTDIVIMRFTEDLEKIDEYSFSLEEPVDVCILPVHDGLYLSFVNRFFEEGLLRQDIFMKKLDYSFTEISHNRITYGSFWEEPSLALFGDTVYLSYASAPLMSFLNRHIVCGALDSHLALNNERRIPVESTADKNIFQASLTATDNGLLLFYRISSKDFTISRFTWDGMVTIRVGNIQGISLTPDLELGEDIIVTRDCWEQYTPSALSAFGKIYLSYTEIQSESQHLKIISAQTPQQLKQAPPSWWETSRYWIVIPTVVVIGAAYMIYLYHKSHNSSSKKKKKQKKGNK